MKLRLFTALILASAFIAINAADSHAYVYATPEEWKAFTEFVNRAPEYGGTCQTPACTNLKNTYNAADDSTKAKLRRHLRRVRGRAGLLRYGGRIIPAVGAFYTGWQIGTELREAYIEHKPPVPPPSNDWYWQAMDFGGVVPYTNTPPGHLVDGIQIPAFVLRHPTAVGTVREMWECRNLSLSPPVEFVSIPESCFNGYQWTMTFRSFIDVPQYDPWWVQGGGGWQKEWWHYGVEEEVPGPVTGTDTAFSGDQLPEKSQTLIQNTYQQQETSVLERTDRQATTDTLLHQSPQSEWAPGGGLDIWGQTEPAPDTGSDTGGASPSVPTEPTDPNQCERWVRPRVNFDPLKQPIHEQFPFGVPFWLYAIVAQMETGESIPSWTINFTGDNELEISFEQIQPIVDIARPILLILSVIGLVMLVAGFSFGSPAKDGD